MLNSTPTPIDARMDALERHLKNENPELLDVVKSYEELDKVAHSSRHAAGFRVFGDPGPVVANGFSARHVFCWEIHVYQ